MRKGQMSNKNERWATHEGQGAIELLLIFLDIVHIVLGCHLLVHSVEVESRIGLDGLGGPESILEATFGQWSATQAM